MRELSSQEMEFVSGASTAEELNNAANILIDHIASSVVASVTAATVGGIIGFKHGGDATGIWGLSLIGQLVGALGGAIIGGIGGAVGGALVSTSYSFPLIQQAVQTIISGSIQ